MSQDYEFASAFREQVLRCSSCGFCQAACPLFGITKRPALNARGKMLVLKEVMEGLIPLNDELMETLCQCTACGNCSTNCPSGVRVPEIVKAARKDMANRGGCHPAFTGMQQVLAGHLNIYAEDEPVNWGRPLGRRADLVYFAGCVGARREEESTEEALELLDRLKIDYTLIDEACCSGILEDVGYSINRRLADRNTEQILTTGAKRVITGCPYCLRTFREKLEYAPLREKGIDFLHISQFLKDFDFQVTTDKVVTYHDPCDLGRHCGIYEEPRATIKKIAPRFVEMTHTREAAVCCGAGGGVRAAYPSQSITMARRRIMEVEEVGAEVLLTECNSCVHNLENARLRRQKFEVLTVTRFINKLLRGEE